MKPAVFEGKTFRCANEAHWPPPHSAIGSAEQVRFRFDDAVYERMKAWERVCGLKQMEASKCQGCQFLRNEMGQPLVASGPPTYRPPTYRKRK